MKLEERAQARGESALFILILAAILVALNIISLRLFFRIDLTRNKAHSLSKGSLRIIENLKDRLTVKAYFTKNLPPPFNVTERYVRDLLEEYQARSKGKMKIEFIDPSTEEKAEEARRAGIREVTHQVIEKDQASQKKGFRGIQFIYMGDSKTIDIVRDTVGLEYEITSKIKQLMGEKVDIGFLQGHKEPKTIRPPPQDPLKGQNQPPAPLEEARKLLSSQYNVREIDLHKGNDEIPEDVKALIVVGATEKIPEKELYRIDQFIMKGGSVAFFIDGISVDTSTGFVTTTENEIGISKFLEHFGIKIRNDIVFDFQCDTVPIRGPFGIPLATRYPAWPLAKIEATHPAIFRLPVLTFPWASSLKVIKHPPAGKVKIDILAKSTTESWREEGNIDLQPNEQDWRGRFNKATWKGPFVLAAAVTGRFRSYFDGKKIPLEEKEKNKEGEEKNQNEPPPDFIKTAEKESRILVTGSSQMVIDPIVNVLARLHRAGDISANQAFLLNTVDWLTQEQDLIEIRAKGVEDPRLREVSDSTRRLIKYGNIVTWPLLFIVFGVVRWIVRGKRSKERTSLPDEEISEKEKEGQAEKEEETEGKKAKS